MKMNKPWQLRALSSTWQCGGDGADGGVLVDWGESNELTDYYTFRYTKLLLNTDKWADRDMRGWSHMYIYAHTYKYTHYDSRTGLQTCVSVDETGSICEMCSFCVCLCLSVCVYYQ